ncbi:hypothetical protein NE237_019726 [Protea cynaroides]|uniref:DNA-3-methyladenine glycosylase I n=1 Tax=Protea cynaroides TaxID=273540 RepID=A0A9Q0H734_9MAGN|nr:hypothetical protein NE237_019726 [Protea cynaroides]
MSKVNLRQPFLERNRSPYGEEKPTESFKTKHVKKIHPVALQSSNSPQSLSSISLLQNSTDSIGKAIPWVDKKVLISLHGLETPEKTETKLTNVGKDSLDSNGVPGVPRVGRTIMVPLLGLSLLERKEITLPNFRKNIPDSNGATLKRCHWVTGNSDKVYVNFHDECWGVPIYNNNELFELLAMSGMLMDYCWTEILKRKELLRECFAQFNPNVVAKISEKEIVEIASNKTLMLTESRVRCIVDNAKCIVKIMDEYGSFCYYIWGYMNYRPMIRRYKYQRNVPLKTAIAETISRDLLKRGFRSVGPVIVYSFMQATGMTIDHLINCFRFNECVSLAERPWRHG